MCVSTHIEQALFIKSQDIILMYCVQVGRFFSSTDDSKRLNILLYQSMFKLQFSKTRVIEFITLIKRNIMAGLPNQPVVL